MCPGVSVKVASAQAPADKLAQPAERAEADFQARGPSCRKDACLPEHRGNRPRSARPSEGGLPTATVRRKSEEISISGRRYSDTLWERSADPKSRRQLSQAGPPG